MHRCVTTCEERAPFQFVLPCAAPCSRSSRTASEFLQRTRGSLRAWVHSRRASVPRDAASCEPWFYERSRAPKR
jgi:hypothetical protein